MTSVDGCAPRCSKHEHKNDFTSIMITFIYFSCVIPLHNIYLFCVFSVFCSLFSIWKVFRLIYCWRLLCRCLFVFFWFQLEFTTCYRDQGESQCGQFGSLTTARNHFIIIANRLFIRTEAKCCQYLRDSEFYARYWFSRHKMMVTKIPLETPRQTGLHNFFAHQKVFREIAELNEHRPVCKCLLKC